MADRIYTHHAGTIAYQGTAEDFARWGIPLPAPEAADPAADHHPSPKNAPEIIIRFHGKHYG